MSKKRRNGYSYFGNGKLDILADGKRNKINQHDREKGDDDGAR